MKKIKSVTTRYIIKVNGEISDYKLSLKEARTTVKNMPVNDCLNVVSIVKQTISESITDIYEPKATKVLVARELDDSLEV
jgi:hypothetical protein